MEDTKRYNYMENVLIKINSKFISLQEEEKKRNNRILESVLTMIVNKMKESDPLFNALFTRVFYGGSFYDGLRVGKPEEFDLDLLLSLPKYAQPVLTTKNVPGFVNLKLENVDGWMAQPEAMPAYRTFNKIFDKDHYLDTQKVLAWMEGIVQKALNSFPQSGAKRILRTVNGDFEVIVHKGGPALTLEINGSQGKMDVDLVACFVFHADKLPKRDFKCTSHSKKDFFIVPKKPKKETNKEATRFWRLSFQEQERELMDNKRTLKPTIKLLKKLRDREKQQSQIASYYIKTAVLHIAEKKNDDFWKNSLSYVFMTVLKEYKTFIETRSIPYYWDTKFNLISEINAKTLENIRNRLNIIINDIEKNVNNPHTIAKYLLTDEEHNTFKSEEMRL